MAVDNKLVEKNFDDVPVVVTRDVLGSATTQGDKPFIGTINGAWAPALVTAR